MTLTVDGKRLTESERLKFLADAEHNEDFNESLPLVPAQVIREESQDAKETATSSHDHQPSEGRQVDTLEEDREIDEMLKIGFKAARKLGWI